VAESNGFAYAIEQLWFGSLAPVRVVLPERSSSSDDDAIVVVAIATTRVTRCAVQRCRAARA
jgi:hypothetical protein